jgi:hypothetical protein
MATAYICLVLAIAITRLLGRGQGTWAGDLFLAGVALLPIAGTLLLGAAAMGLGIMGLMDLWVLMGCYSTLILYLGCTQLHQIEEPYAMLAVPLMLFASGKAATLVVWH